jgi:hypothetical protein
MKRGEIEPLTDCGTKNRKPNSAPYMPEAIRTYILGQVQSSISSTMGFANSSRLPVSELRELSDSASHA